MDVLDDGCSLGHSHVCSGTGDRPFPAPLHRANAALPRYMNDFPV